MARRVTRTLPDPAHNPTEVLVDDFSVHPETLAGDGFAYAGDETPHGCYEGWVYLGFEGEDENGNPCEELERVPCRRCHGETR